jgi:transposase
LPSGFYELTIFVAGDSFEPLIARYYQRKKAKTHRVVAIKAVAHKLARACYYMMRDGVPFDVNRAFA